MRRVLVASHTSSLWPPTHIKTVQVDSAYGAHDTPLSQPTPTLVSEHASHGSVFTSDRVGDILIRVLAGGHVLELAALYRPVEPIRIVFPSPIILKPSLLLWQDIQLRLIVVTEHASLFRLAFPADDKLWHSSRRPARWCQEYRIKTHPDQLVGPVHTLGCSVVVIGLRNAGTLRLDAHRIGDATRTDDEWTESVMPPGGFLASWASYVPFHGTGSTSQPICIESLSYMADSELLFTLSRSMVVRVWAPRIGCIAEASVPALFPARSASPVAESSRTTRSFGSSAARMKVFSLNPDSDDMEDSIRLVVFIPTEDSADSAGYVSVLAWSSERHLSLLHTLKCPRDTFHAELIDMIIHDGQLYTLWHKDVGASVKSIPISSLLSPSDGEVEEQWIACSYREAEAATLPTPEIEASEDSASISARFLSFVLRPETFSVVTLQTALEQYCEALLSLPSPPSAINRTYSTLKENIAAVVGCSVQLATDPETGLPRRAQYMNSLKRDWESFIARCTDIERAARYPISLARSSYRGVVLLERERTAVICNEDSAMSLQRILFSEEDPSSDVPHSLRSAYQIYQTVNRYDPKLPIAINRDFISLISQDVAFAYSDVIRDVSRTWQYDLNLCGLSHSMQDIKMHQALEKRYLDEAIASIASIETIVKAEMHTHPDGCTFEWERSLVSSLTAASIQSRYRLAQILALFLLLFGSSIEEMQNTSLATFFSLYRGLTLLDLVAKGLTEIVPPPVTVSRQLGQHFADPAPDTYLAPGPVTRDQSQLRRHQSTLRSLVSGPELHASLLDTAQATLTETGLLAFAPASSPDGASEIDFLTTLYELNLHGALGECTAYFPQSPAINFIMGQVLLSQCRAEYAASRFAIVAGHVGNVRLMSVEDREALDRVFPVAEMSHSLFAYYFYVASLFVAAGETEIAVDMCNLALSFALPGDEVEELWKKVVHCNAELGKYDEAFMALLDCPLFRLRPALVNYVVQSLCEGGASDILIASSFGSLAADIESSLQWKARNSDCMGSPSYSHILYARYLHSGDHRSAALAIFEHARRLSQVVAQGNMLLEIRRHQADTYLLAINALSLLDPKDAWIVVEDNNDVSADTDEWDRDNGSQTRPAPYLLTRIVPPTLFSRNTTDHDIVDIPFLRRELLLTTARMDLITFDATLTPGNESAFSPLDIVIRFRDLGHFDQAFALADRLHLPLAPIFQSFLELYIRFKRNPGGETELGAIRWLQSPRVASLPGDITERAWRYLESVLEEYEEPGDTTYHKIVLEALVKEGGPGYVPKGLSQPIWENEKEELVRLYLKHGHSLAASRLALSLFEGDTQVKKTASAAWRPYSVIEQIISQSESSGEENIRLKILDYVDKV